MARKKGFTTQAPREVTVIIAIVLWLIGLVSVLGLLALPNNLGVWALVIAGLLLILGSLLDAI
jgi:hypothetical protein